MREALRRMRSTALAWPGFSSSRFCRSICAETSTAVRGLRRSCPAMAISRSWYSSTRARSLASSSRRRRSPRTARAAVPARMRSRAAPPSVTPRDQRSARVRRCNRWARSAVSSSPICWTTERTDSIRWIASRLSSGSSAARSPCRRKSTARVNASARRCSKVRSERSRCCWRGLSWVSNARTSTSWERADWAARNVSASSSRPVSRYPRWRVSASVASASTRAIASCTSWVCTTQRDPSRRAESERRDAVVTAAMVRTAAANAATIRIREGLLDIVVCRKRSSVWPTASVHQAGQASIAARQSATVGTIARRMNPFPSRPNCVPSTTRMFRAARRAAYPSLVSPAGTRTHR